MSDWMMQQVVEQHRAEMQRKVHEDRLAGEALAALAVARSSRNRQRLSLAPILARLGDGLVIAGNYLKVRYGNCVQEYGVSSVPKPSVR
ncbi:MAG: hypothetical protein U0528_10645 [Anaerolineae bacterium]